MASVKWYDIRHSAEKWRVFNYFLGGRGIGKTYSAFTYAFLSDLKFLYLRSTEKQLSICMSPDRGNPFKEWSKDHDRHIYIEGSADVAEIVEESNRENGENHFQKWGYAAALSTFENLRGVSFSDVDLIIYDEFIQITPLRFDSFRAFLNMYETVNRNREITGGEAVKVIFLANTQEIENDILLGFDLVREIETMKANDQTRLSIRDHYIELCQSSVSRAKEKSVLYRNLPDTDAYKIEAIKNEFSRNDFSGIGKVKNLREFNAICMLDSITIWRHKSKPLFYCVQMMYNKVPTFNSKNQKGLFCRHFGGVLMDSYARNQILCDSYVTRKHLLDVLNLR